MKDSDVGEECNLDWSSGLLFEVRPQPRGEWGKNILGRRNS